MAPQNAISTTLNMGNLLRKMTWFIQQIKDKLTRDWRAESERDKVVSVNLTNTPTNKHIGVLW